MLPKGLTFWASSSARNVAWKGSWYRVESGKSKKKKSFKEQITSKGSQYAGLWTSSETKILGLRLRIGITNLVKEEDVGHMN